LRQLCRIKVMLGRPTKKILLVGSSHTRLFFPFVSRFLEGRARVAKLPHDAGRTDEMLLSISAWPVEGQDIIHLYAGLRDLLLDVDDEPYVKPEQFRANLKSIIRDIRRRTDCKIILSNLPPVTGEVLDVDPDCNNRIALYNSIIREVALSEGVAVHDFHSFALGYDGGEKYSDGVHFTQGFYRAFGRELARYLMRS
jgi:hypothetical protein